MAYVKTFMLVSMVMGISSAAWSEYDKPDKFKCEGNKFLSRFESIHKNQYEDRIFQFTCADVPGCATLTNCKWTNWLNFWDKKITYRCPDNNVIAGIKSYHHNYFKDRRYNYYCCELQGAETTQCSGGAYVNKYDEPVDFTVPAGQVLVGIYSQHANRHEDRVFGFVTCRVLY